jgi:Ni/Co efflux regulator RcnB
MRKALYVVAAAVALLGASVSMAQDQRPDDHKGNPKAGPDRSADQARPAPKSRPAVRRGPVARSPLPGKRPAHRFLAGGGGWHKSIHASAFRYPSGFSYRLWATGEILPPVFLTSAYFYDDYAPLGLAPPPAGYRWVRYGPDLVLVNVVSGRIADTVDGVFY